MQVGDLVIRRINSAIHWRQASAVQQREMLGMGIVVTKQMAGSPAHPCVPVVRCSVSPWQRTACGAWMDVRRFCWYRKRATPATARVDVNTGLVGCPSMKSRLNLPFRVSLQVGHFLSGNIINLWYNRRVSGGKDQG